MKSNFRPAVAMQIRLPVELRAQLEKIKVKTGKSINQIITEMLRNYLEADDVKKTTCDVKYM